MQDINNAEKTVTVSSSSNANNKKRRGASMFRTGVTLTLVLLILAALVASYLYLGEEASRPIFLGLLGLLAVVGIFALFAFGVGLMRFDDGEDTPIFAHAPLDAIDDAVILTAEGGNVVYANEAYLEMTGALGQRDVRSLNTLLGGQDGLSEALYRLSKGAADKKTTHEELRLTSGFEGTSESAPKWYRVSVLPMFGGDNPDEVDATTLWRVSDVTEDRKNQEVAFQELQNVINYLDHAPTGFFSAEPDGRLTYINATLASWLSLDLAEFESGTLHIHDLIRGDGAALLNAKAGGQSNGEVGPQINLLDVDLVKRSGRAFPVRLLHLVPFTGEGVPVASRTIVLNQQQMVGESGEEGSAPPNGRFSRFFNSTPIAIAAVRADGTLGRKNAAFVRLFSKVKGHLDRDKLLDMVAETERDKLQTALQQATEGLGEIEPVDVLFESDGETSARIYCSAAETAAQDFEPAEGSTKVDEVAMIYAIDTTEQRALEEQFAQGQKMQAVGQLAGGVAHDFNNVLTAIIGFSDLLLASHKSSDPAFQDIMNIKQNANRAASLVRQLLAFSRRQTLRPQVVDLRDVLEELNILLDRLLGENVHLEVQHSRDLWPIKADVNQLEQVIINLAVNARDAMPEGGDLTIASGNLNEEEAVALGHKGLTPGDYVKIDITDTGTGMPPEVMEKIFEPFFSTKDVGKGTGLGLSTVYGIVKQTGGYIYPMSVVGEGTTFRIMLPRHIPDEKEEPAQAAAAVEAPAQDLSGSARVLLVEDEDAVRAFAMRALQARGYTVFEASTGTEALEVMEEEDGEIDLVVSDVVMPEMDGPTLLSKLRAKQPDLQIIFVSGYAEEAFSKNLDEGEEFAFLPKPFSLKQLATKVKEVLEG